MSYQKLNKGAFALSSALSFTVLYVVKTILLAFYKTAILNVGAKIHHFTSFEQFAPFIKVTISGFIIGLILVFAISYVFSFLIAYFYDLFTNNNQLNRGR